MNSKFLFSSLLLAAGMIPSAVFAQGNCTGASITPVTACIIPQNANGTLYTMVYRLNLDGNTNSCVMNRSSNNTHWPYPSYLKAYTNENNPGHQPRPYWMAARESSGDYTITKDPATFVCVRDIGPTCDGDLDSELSYNFAGGGSNNKQYLVRQNHLSAELCSSQAANHSLSVAEYATINTACGNLTTLPVTLISFGGHDQSGGIVLNWKTASEINFSNFEVQRSTNGTTFTTIGMVTAAGYTTTSEKQYAFTDTSANTSSNNYYRLKMNDIDGQSKYSNVVPIKSSGLVGSQGVYPNPIANGQQASVKLQAGRKQLANVYVYSSSNALVAKQAIQLESGTQTFSVPGSNRLKAGVYTVTISTDGDQPRTYLLTVQ